MRVLIPDTWHFHRRNFSALYDYFAAADVRIWVEKKRSHWWKQHGDYRGLARQLAPHRTALDGLGLAELAVAEHRGINLFDVARAELLCLLLPRWSDGAGPNDAAVILARAWASAEDREDLLLCLAAARDWIEFWTRTLSARGPFTHALVFSGSYIYTRALQEVGRNAGLRLFALESFFTGNEFYFEERSTPLANQSRLADPNWIPRQSLPDDPGDRARLRADAHRRLAGMRNKNVRPAPMALVAPPFRDKGGGTVLVVGQVLNDFSLIETPTPELSSPAVYRRVIGQILERTDCTVVFKAHPWERKRPNIKGAMTLDILERWAKGLPEERRSRLRLVEAEPIGGLFAYADYAVALCSQGLLEAAQAGLKPVQIGGAFFGGAGFTHDYADVDGFVSDLAAGRVEGRLRLAEYRAFEDFLVRALVFHLVPNAPEGVAKIAARMGEPGHVPSLDEVELFPAETPSLRRLIGRALANPIALLHLVVARSRRRSL